LLLGWVEEVCPSDVRAIGFIADAKRSEDDAAVEVVCVREGRGAEVVGSAALDDGGVGPFELVRVKLRASEKGINGKDGKKVAKGKETERAAYISTKFL